MPRPNQVARWIAARPVLGAVLLGPLFAATLAVNFLLFSGLSVVIVALGFVFFTLYGPFLVWVIGRNIGRWDAAHRDG